MDFGSTNGIVTLSEDEVRELQDNDQVQVYDTTYTEIAEHEKLDMVAVEAVIDAIVNASATFEGESCDRNEHIFDRVPHARAFAKRTHPTIFEKVADPTASTRDIRVMKVLIATRRKVETGDMTGEEADQWVQDFLMRECHPQQKK